MYGGIILNMTHVSQKKVLSKIVVAISFCIIAVLLSSCTRIGRRPCDIPDTTWQTKDGSVTIYGCERNDIDSTTGEMVINGETVKVVFYFNYIGGTSVYKYVEGYTDEDYLADLSGEFWIGVTLRKNKMVFSRCVAEEYFDEIFGDDDEIVLYRLK